MAMPLTATTADTEIADLKRTLKFVNSQNSALIKQRDNDRADALDELVKLLAMRTPTENTFCDSYRHCFSLVIDARDNYRADLESR